MATFTKGDHQMTGVVPGHPKSTRLFDILVLPVMNLQLSGSLADNTSLTVPAQNLGPFGLPSRIKQQTAIGPVIWWDGCMPLTGCSKGSRVVVISAGYTPGVFPEAISVIFHDAPLTISSNNHA